MIFENVKRIIANHFGIDEDKIEADTSLAEDLYAESMDVLEILVDLEDEFDINIPEEDAEELKTVEDYVKYIESNS